MKKILAVGGAVLGVILAAALVVFIFFPGLPTYIKVKHTFENTDELLSTFDGAGAPSDYVSHAVRGVRFSAPAGWEAHSVVRGIEPGSYKSADGEMISVFSRNFIDDEEISRKAQELAGSEYDLDPWSGYEYNEEDYRHMFSSIGIELPEHGLPSRMLWYIRDGFTAKDCLRLRGKDRRVFLEIADFKDEAMRSEDMWKIGGTGFSAYVGHITGSGLGSGLWTVNIFPDSDENSYFLVMIKCSDETTVKRIVSSIELE